MSDFDFKVEAEYRVRFINPDHIAELVNLYHLARTALLSPTRYERMLWASRWFAKNHPYVSRTGAYKDLEGLLHL